ncbi:MAG: hypothetical protein JWM21_961 [Acidobacteria bacterium]|nr:hypothetical protein [Acidobacteriota bacterium]
MFFVNRIVLALVIGAMAGSLALGKNKRDSITFPENVKINGTLVKSGTYDVSFDDKTNELAIIKGGKVVAKVTGTLEKRAEKARRTEYRTANGTEGTQLVRVAFSGSDQDIVVGSSSASN